MQVSHRFAVSSAVFDDAHLVSCAGLVPVMTLAAQTGLPKLLADKISIPAPKIKSGSANPSPKLTTVIAGMCVGATALMTSTSTSCVAAGSRHSLAVCMHRQLLVLCCGSSPSTRPAVGVGPASSSGRTLCAGGPAGSDTGAFIDIHSLLRPVYGHAKQGASYGHTKIAGKQVLRKGLSPLATTISTPERRRSSPGSAARRLDQFREGCGPHGRPSHRHRPRRRRARATAGAWRFVLRHPVGGGRLPSPQCALLGGDDPQYRG
uniref:Uncharacterized protein n=1 Tax=Mycolicibacterium fortuitum TaxID=1766 RepID=Q9RDW0_MYCFO|nr:hypothetical protein [Mycolicibacterium fortuitum]